MTFPDNPDKGDRFQMEDAAFWWVYGEYGWGTEPIDEHAIYGHAEYYRDGDIEVPVRNSLRDKTTAIRTVEPGDRVRINEENWMVAVEPDTGWVDEGFTARFENGEVQYAIRANDVGGTHGTPECRMRRRDDFSSVGIVSCIEVDWSDVRGSQ